MFKEEDTGTSNPYGGVLLGNAPTIIFDLRHDFYHARTLWQYFLDTLSLTSQAQIEYHIFLQFWPAFSILAGLLVYWIYRRSKVTAAVLLFIYLVVNLALPWVSFSGPVGMSKNLNYPKLRNTAQAIKTDNPEYFNVTEDFNSRGQELRYILSYQYQTVPMGVEDYGASKILYALVQSNYDFNKTTTWEVTVFQAKKIEKLYQVDDSYALYKLTK